MKDIYLTSYSVKGIKTLDQLVSLSFYKKTISKEPETQEYNIKGIYGMNGSGKSGIVTSVDILRNLLVNPNYLNNPIVQNNLDAIINKKTNELFIEAEYMTPSRMGIILLKYGVTLTKDITGKYIISREILSSKKAISKSESMDVIFEVVNGEINYLRDTDEIADIIRKKTTNLLTTTSMCALFIDRILMPMKGKLKKDIGLLYFSMCTLLILGKKLFVYMDQSDDHRKYFVQNSLGYLNELGNSGSQIDNMINHYIEIDSNSLNALSVIENVIPKEGYIYFEKSVSKLQEFLRIFKNDLQKIEIDRKEDKDVYVCNLIMVYDSYKIDAEFESTGIKKLIKLYAYLREMVQGGIVFIDEFDSNLHDVYLCALLEYLMEYGEGQLCFTTHNVGPMDILKQRKKSIDFLSVDHKIYPWTTNGNYSPSKLYRNGMIEGSPFNVDSVDFIGVFNLSEEDE